MDSKARLASDVCAFHQHFHFPCNESGQMKTNLIERNGCILAIFKEAHEMPLARKVKSDINKVCCFTGWRSISREALSIHWSTLEPPYCKGIVTDAASRQSLVKARRKYPLSHESGKGSLAGPSSVVDDLEKIAISKTITYLNSNTERSETCNSPSESTGTVSRKDSTLPGVSLEFGLYSSSPA